MIEFIMHKSGSGVVCCGCCREEYLSDFRVALQIAQVCFAFVLSTRDGAQCRCLRATHQASPTRLIHTGLLNWRLHRTGGAVVRACAQAPARPSGGGGGPGGG